MENKLVNYRSANFLSSLLPHSVCALCNLWGQLALPRILRIYTPWDPYCREETHKEIVWHYRQMKVCIPQKWYIQKLRTKCT